MKDTIADCLAMAMNHAWLAGGVGSEGRRPNPWEAVYQNGLASGYAFRAAELAYDLGQLHGIMLRRMTFTLPGRINTITIMGKIGV